MKYEDMQNEILRLEKLAEDADKARRGGDWGSGMAHIVFGSKRTVTISVYVGIHVIKVDADTPEEAFRKADREILRYSNNDTFLAQTLGIAV